MSDFNLSEWRRNWKQSARARMEPRWQGSLLRPLLRLLGRRHFFSFEHASSFELLARRLLGQPLSAAHWDRMSFNDKIAYRRLCTRDPLLQTFSDKLAARDHVAQRLGAECLPRLLRVGPHADTFVDLVGPFVLKANQGSGMVLVVNGESTLSSEQLHVAQAWLDVDYCWDELEWGYSDAQRLLLAEEFLHISGEMQPPPDYKFFTFHGQVEMIEIDEDRFTDHRQALRRPDWSPIRGTIGVFPSSRTVDMPRPQNLDQMLEWASILGQDIDFIRVDLYDLGDRILVGELTPYPNGGNKKFRPGSLDAWLGKAWRGPAATGS